MKLKEFNNIFNNNEYKEAIFGNLPEVSESELAGRLYKQLNKGAQFILGFFEILAKNVQEGDEHKRKISARLLKKAEDAVQAGNAALPEAAAKRVAEIVKIGCDYEKARKDAKKAKLADIQQKSPELLNFDKEALPLSELAAKAVLLRKDDLKEAKALHERINAASKEQAKKGQKAKLNFPDKALVDPKLNCTAMNGTQKFIFSALPRTAEAAAELFGMMLRQGGTLFVSTLESHEAKNKHNHFWTKEKVECLQLNGWKIEHAGRRVVQEGFQKPIALFETTLKASNGAETRTLTHLHYDGWVDHYAASDETLLMAMLELMHNLSSSRELPIAINCHGGVGRTGITGLCYELMRKVDDEVAKGTAPEKITVNIPEEFVKMRLQGRNIIGQPAGLAQIYAVLGAYYDRLPTKQAIANTEWLKGAQMAAKTIYAYTL